MESVFSYIIGLGAAVMMPVIFTILGLCIGIKFGDALKSGLKVGVGFVGLSIVTALLTSALGPALNSVVGLYDLQLKVFDGCRSVHNPGVSGCQHHHVADEDDSHCQHRPVELLAFRIHRCGDLFCLRLLGMGLLRRDNMLYRHPDTC